MKKVININFQGRIIPIEETAYDLLKQYIDSLRKYFANEEGRDEIINDIEGRIAELFSERLKTGITCITDEDVQAVIAGMGRPEDFDAQEGETMQPSAAASSSSRPSGRGSLYRNADDKILGGVCSGLANYLAVDPIILRIFFVALSGLLFWVYILLWVIVPSKSVQSNITKRLFRSAGNKMIAGVSGGIAAYFNIDVWIPRLIFLLPLILALLSGGFNALWWNWDFGFLPKIISGSFGWTLFITYIILWIAVPVASSSSEKLEMRGEKVDLNSIRNTIKGDLQTFKTKAEKWGSEAKDSAAQVSQNISTQARSFTSEAAQATRRSSYGLLHAIGLLFRVAFIFLFGLIAIALFCVFIALLFGSIAIAPLKDFILEGTLQNALQWITLVMLFVIPLMAFITWAIRRMMGIRSSRHYVGFVFSGLWMSGLISGIVLLILMASNFRHTSAVHEEQVVIGQPEQKLIVDVEKPDWKKKNNRFFGMDMDGEWPVFNPENDSIFLNTVKITMVKSNDTAFHLYRMRTSRGSTVETATALAEKISFDPLQQDSILVLPRGFYISRKDRYRNQRVWLVFEIPAGKKIAFKKGISDYDWVDIRFNSRNVETDGDWNDRHNMHWPDPGKEYIMTAEGDPQQTSD